MSNEGHANGIKKTIENVIGVDTTLMIKKKSEEDIKREKFEKIIHSLEALEVRSVILKADLSLDLHSYDEKFYSVIDSLLELQFGEETSELIYFYLYDRVNIDGSINEMVDSEQKPVPLNSVLDLWELVKKLQSKPKKKSNASSKKIN